MTNIKKDIKENRKLRISLEDTQIIYLIPANWLLLIANLPIPIYLSTESILGTLAVVVLIWLIGYYRTKKDPNWSKNLKQQRIFKVFLCFYCTIILVLIIKIIFMWRGDAI